MRAAFVIGLLASLVLNVWLVVRERAAVTAGTACAPCPAVVGANALGVDSAARASADPRAVRELTAFASVARSIAASKEARGGSRVAVDARMVGDVQCRVAREKAAEAWRREAEGIQRALLAYEEPSDVERATQLRSERETLADVIGADPDDARVLELAEKRMALKGETSRRWKESLSGDPPDWRTGVDVLLDFYRRCDADGLRILGEEKAADVRLADIDERAALLAIGASLVDEPWETTLAALEP